MLVSQILSSKMVPFLYRNRASVASPCINAFFTHLRSSVTMPIGVVGLSWGGFYAVQLTYKRMIDGKESPPLVDAGFVASPAQLSVPGDIKDVSAPLGLAVGTKDMALNMKAIDQIKSLLLDPERPRCHEVVVYEGAKHGELCTSWLALLFVHSYVLGFAVRSSPGDKAEKQLGLDAEGQAVDWFRKCFAARGATA